MAQTLRVRLAADARTKRTHYTDDQVWEVAFGEGDSPSIAIQTRYGGRVGLLRLVPMFSFPEEESVYTADALPATLEGFSPSSALVTVSPAPELQARLYLWAMESAALGGRVTLVNKGATPQTLSLHLFAQAMRGERESVPMSLIEVATGQGRLNALSLGEMGNLRPALLLENAEETPTSKLIHTVTIPAGKIVQVRFVVATLPSLEESVKRAYLWLSQTDWDAHIAEINHRLSMLPVMDTDESHFDAAIGWSQRVALQSLMGRKGKPFPALVFSRTPASGYSVRGDGSDYPAAWHDTPPLDTLYLTSNLATVDPEAAKGVVRNFIAGQKSDGAILGDDRLLLPMLAQLVHWIDLLTGDEAFVRETFPGLLRFWLRWFKQDADRDGFPEWGSALQANLPPYSSFKAGAQLGLFESPDLAAYLLNEAENLRRLGTRIGADTTPIDKPYRTLLEALRPAPFAYRDRDTHQLPERQPVYRGKGDQRLAQSVTLNAPARLLIQVKGSPKRPGTLQAEIQGVNQAGKAVSETIEDAAFHWQGLGSSVTSKTVWARVDALVVNGLSRVLDVEVETVGAPEASLFQYLPLISEAFQSEAGWEALFNTYLTPHGLAGTPAHTKERWILPTLTVWFGLKLLDRGETEASLDLFKRLSAAQVSNLVEGGAFYQWLDAESGEGRGQPDYAAGILPLYWLTRLLGVFVLNGGTVRVLGASAFPGKVQMVQHGVKIARTPEKLLIQFPSGHKLQLAGDASPQTLSDPGYQPTPAPEPAPAPGQKRVRVGVRNEEPLSNDVWGEAD